MTRAPHAPALAGLEPAIHPPQAPARASPLVPRRTEGSRPAGTGLRGGLAIAVCLILTGCHAYDTYSRPGVWHPDDANAANIAAMAARPADLIRGHGVGDSDGRQAVKAISHVWWDGQAFPPMQAGGATPGGSGAKGFATPLGGTSGSGGSP